MEITRLRPVQDGSPSWTETQWRVSSIWGLGSCLVCLVPCLHDAVNVVGELHKKSYDQPRQFFYWIGPRYFAQICEKRWDGLRFVPFKLKLRPALFQSRLRSCQRSQSTNEVSYCRWFFKDEVSLQMCYVKMSFRILIVLSSYFIGEVIVFTEFWPHV